MQFPHARIVFEFESAQDCDRVFMEWERRGFDVVRDTPRTVSAGAPYGWDPDVQACLTFSPPRLPWFLDW